MSGNCCFGPVLVTCEGERYRQQSAVCWAAATLRLCIVGPLKIVLSRGLRACIIQRLHSAADYAIITQSLLFAGSLLVSKARGLAAAVGGHGT